MLVSGKARSMSVTLFNRTTTPYDGDESFLSPATPRTKIWTRLNELFLEERRKGVLDISQIPTSITAHVRVISTVRTK